MFWSNEESGKTLLLFSEIKIKLCFKDIFNLNLKSMNGPTVIKFVQQLNFSIPKEAVEKALRNVKEGGSVQISIGINEEQKIYVSVSADKSAEESPEQTMEQSPEQQQAKLYARTSAMNNSSDDDYIGFGCPNPPGCKPPIIH
jgi:folylpolyglutamate synthase/dihydropteroate synthase